MPNELRPRSKGIAAEIRAELAKQELSVSSVANKTGIPVSTLRRSVRGFRPFTTDELFAITSLLGVRMSEIVSRAESEAA